MILAPLRPDIAEVIGADSTLKNIVINVSDDQQIPLIRRQIQSMLEVIIYNLRSPRTAAAPLTYNFAKEFPIHNPFLIRYYHVYRSSVYNLLRTFDRRNGIRLWCSVRRSGKTTACFDLGATTGGSVIISQTCDSTHQQSESYYFYDQVTAELEKGRQLQQNFFLKLIEMCAGSRISPAGRCVFVLDEYETLFGRLDTAVSENKALRYTVVQPLLNQMVGFT